MGKRRDRLGAQQRVGQLQQGVGATGTAGVQLGAEGGQPHEGGRQLGHDRAASPSQATTSNLASANSLTGLNHKLSVHGVLPGMI